MFESATEPDSARDIDDGIAVLRLTQSGDGVLRPAARAALLQALVEADEDDAIRAIVLTGTGAVFSGGFDLREYDQGIASPTIRELTLAIENHTKPIVAALNGSALETGFEIALAAHARVARAGVKVGLPQVSLGMLPAGGATQRLPRLLGARYALDLLLSGRAFPVEDARLSGLFDQITEGVPLPEAQEYAARLAEIGQWRKTCETMAGLDDPAHFEAAIRAAMQRLKQSQSVESDIIRSVEAALLLPFGQGLNLEETAAEDRRLSAPSRSRRHLFSADRLAAQQVARVPGKARPVGVVAVIAGGPRAVALAASSLDLCQEVIVYAPEIATAERLANAIDKVLAGLVRQNTLSEEARENLLERLSLSDDPEIFNEVDLVFDDGPLWDGPKFSASQAVWCVLPEASPMAEQARRTGLETLMLQPYRPAHAASLIEIMPSAQISAPAIATVAQFFRRMRRSVLLTAQTEISTPDFIGNQISAPLYLGGLVLARHGADPQAIEDATSALGFSRGVFDMIDREDAGHVVARLSRGFPNVPGPDWLAERIAFMDLNWPGDGVIYVEGREGRILDPDLSAWLSGWRQRSGVAARFPDVSMSTALHAAVVNRVAALVRQQQLAHAEFVDLCLVRGFGLRRDQGGLLFQADQQGLLPLLSVMKALEPLSPLWKPDPLIEEMLKNGRRFFDRTDAKPAVG